MVHLLENQIGLRYLAKIKSDQVNILLSMIALIQVQKAKRFKENTNKKLSIANWDLVNTHFQKKNRIICWRLLDADSIHLVFKIIEKDLKMKLNRIVLNYKVKMMKNKKFYSKKIVKYTKIRNQMKILKPISKSI